MNEEARQLIKEFLRRWSTTELTEQTRSILEQDIVQVKAMLHAMEEDASLVEQARKAPDRHWFAQQLQEL